MYKNSIFNLFGTSTDELNKLSEKLSKLSLKDYITNDESISGAFNELPKEKQDELVKKMNKINSMFSDIFGTKDEVWTADDFKDSTVKYKSYSTSTEPKKDEKKVEKKCDCKNCQNECKNTTCEDETPKFGDAEYCDQFGSCAECPSVAECKPEEDEMFNDSICSELLSEIEENDTDDEETVDTIADYVLEILKNKKDKKYVLHPESDVVPPAVEVFVPNSVVDTECVNNIHVMTKLHDVLVDLIKAPDAYISRDTKRDGLTIYIPLKKQK